MNKTIPASEQVGISHSVSHTLVKKTVDLICGKWRLYIIFKLSDKNRRYSDLRRMIPEVSEKILIQELKAMIKDGLIERHALGERPLVVEYGLTAQTQQLLPKLMQLMQAVESFPVDGKCSKNG